MPEPVSPLALTYTLNCYPSSHLCHAAQSPHSQHLLLPALAAGQRAHWPDTMAQDTIWPGTRGPEGWPRPAHPNQQSDIQLGHCTTLLDLGRDGPVLHCQEDCGIQSRTLAHSNPAGPHPHQLGVKHCQQELLPPFKFWKKRQEGSLPCQHCAFSRPRVTVRTLRT